MKKIVAVLAAGLMLFGSGLAGNAAGAATLFAPMNFSEYEAGTAPRADTSNTSFRDVIKGASSTAAIELLGEEKALCFYGSGKNSTADNTTLAYLYRPVTGRAYIAMDFYMDYKYSSVGVSLRSADGVYANLIKIVEGMLFFNDVNVGRFLPKQWHNISFLFDNDKKTTALYFDGEEYVAEMPLGVTADFSQAANQLRINVSGVSGTETRTWLDNLVIYQADAPVLGAELKKLAGANTGGGTTSNAKQFTNYNAIRKSIVFEEGNAKTFLYSVPSSISPYDDSIVPFQENGQMMLPLRYTAERMGAVVSANSDGSVRVYKNGVNYILSPSGCRVGEETLPYSIRKVGDTNYVTAEFFELFGAKVYISSGIIIVGKDKIEENADNTALLKDLAAGFEMEAQK